MGFDTTVQYGETIHFSVTTHNPHESGVNRDTDETPRYHVFEEATDTAILADQAFTKRTGFEGVYRGTFAVTGANGFEANKWYDVIASATVASIQAWYVPMTFMAYSGGLEVDVTAVSGNNVSIENFRDNSAVYYADIKLTYDGAFGTGRDEYNVTWFKNAQTVVSGDVTSDTYLRLVDRATGAERVTSTAMEQRQTPDEVLNFYFHNVTAAADRLDPGEAVIAEVSGVIDGGIRSWYKVITRDSGVK